jgi:hypothetical protein
MKCGDYGAVTVRGTPCQRNAGWGIPGEDEGPCKDHVDQVPDWRTPAEPEPVHIVAPEGYAYALRIDRGTMAKALEVSLSPFELRGEQPEPEQPEVPEPEVPDAPEEPDTDPDPGEINEPPPPVEPELPAPPLPEPDEPVQGVVQYPSPEVAFICGPQLQSGSDLNPWPWFDSNASARGLVHGEAGTQTSGFEERIYYDLALCLYIAFYRTGDEQFRTYARAVADMAYGRRVTSGTGTAPRSVALGGIMLRAMDGKPEYWDWITRWVDHHLWNWIERRFSKEELHYGVRDGGYALLYAAQLAVVHPDPAQRASMLARAHVAAVQYYAPRQNADGSWYWYDSAMSYELFREDGIKARHQQPLMTGLLLDGLVAVHLLTDDPIIANMIVRGTERLHETSYRGHQPVATHPQHVWRGMWYTVWEPTTILPAPPATPSDPRYHIDGVTVVRGTTALRGGSDTNSIREVRQLNVLCLHAYGYAYRLTRDSRFKTWGDEVFAASYGNSQGPNTDQFRSLADFRGKEYNQSYRSAGRYLAWRAG